MLEALKKTENIHAYKDIPVSPDDWFNQFQELTLLVK
jgi:hypothetical protein